MLRELKKGNIGIRVLKEKKLTGGINTHYSLGYNVLATKADDIHWGGIVIVLREEAGWQVGGVTSFGPKMVSFTIMTGWK